MQPETTLDLDPRYPRQRFGCPHQGRSCFLQGLAAQSREMILMKADMCRRPAVAGLSLQEGLHRAVSSAISPLDFLWVLNTQFKIYKTQILRTGPAEPGSLGNKLIESRCKGPSEWTMSCRRGCVHLFLCEACTGMVSFRSHLRKVRRGYLANVSGRIMKTLKKRDLSSQNIRLWRATSMASLGTRTVCQLSLPIPRFKL